jgi:hypothetical protein
MATKTRRSISTAVDHSSDVAISPSGLAEIGQVLENLDLLNKAGRQANANQKQALAATEAALLAHLALLRTGNLRAKELSGAAWVPKFPDSKSTSDLAAGFKGGVDAFIAAMKAAGTSVTIGTTLRPPKRAYLMHYSFRIGKKEIKAADVPAMSGVDIEWVHSSDQASVNAANDMVAGYNIVAKPALNSRHTEGRAIDMTISWTGNFKVKNKDGTTTEITSQPKTGENADLHKVGATYGVIKASFAGDPPHWSDDGH